MTNTATENILVAKLPSRLCKFSLQGVHNNLCKPITMLIVDKFVELTVSKKKQLKLKTVLLALIAKLRFRLTFLCQNVMLVFMSCASLCQ